jgi:DNA-binding LacI/PurR family transcriptional regulator
VPEDVSVVGYDDTRVARLPWADLTTVRQDTSTLATTALELALSRVERGGPAREVVVAPELVLRSSAGLAPG